MPASRPSLVSKVVKLDVSVKKRLERLGKVVHRSPHWLMKEAITRYLVQEEDNEQLKRETLKRWTEAESGKVVSGRAVAKWLDTWGTTCEEDRPPCES